MTEDLNDQPSPPDPLSEPPAEPVFPASAVPDAAPESVPAPLRIAVSALSDVGCVRANNEDSFGYDEALGIFVVCDGMGGMASGEVASSRAVAAILNSFAGSDSSSDSVSARLLYAI